MDGRLLTNKKSFQVCSSRYQKCLFAESDYCYYRILEKVEHDTKKEDLFVQETCLNKRKDATKMPLNGDEWDISSVSEKEWDSLAVYHVPDTLTEDVCPDRARLSLPKNLILKPSKTLVDSDQTILGVWSTDNIPRGTRFGPFKGNIYAIDQVPPTANRNYFWRSNIYFYTIKPIKPDEELLVWYCKEFAARLDYPITGEQMLHQISKPSVSAQQCPDASPHHSSEGTGSSSPKARPALRTCGTSTEISPRTEGSVKSDEGYLSNGSHDESNVQEDLSDSDSDNFQKENERTAHRRKLSKKRI
ncbi:hypothetical protein Avbf_09375 [Armadillidium vulgare]|nr:hypothetical protein Avbf_09375 [Armadillidium vulgare]